ncbi:MAG: RNA polymerase sigma factor [Acidimicrobiales bacterium]
MVSTEESAFRPLYDVHLGAIYRYFARRVPPAEIDDYVADVFVVAWRRFDVMPEDAHGRTLWLYGVARRVLADHHKAEQRRRHLEQRLRSHAVTTAAPGRAVDLVLPMTWPGSDGGAGGRPEVSKAIDDPSDLLAAALGAVSADDREVLKLVTWEQLTNKEAAEVLGCSVNALAIRLHRAKRRLAARYAELVKQPSANAGAAGRRRGGTHA